ncbi:MAG: arylesterase [Caulobacter sp.]|nr:arylesterase [Caulobacter sp.]
MTKINSRHLVDPLLSPLLDAFPTVALSMETLPAMRARAMPFPDSGEGKDTVEVTRRTVAGPVGAPEVEVFVYRPLAASAARPCVFHVHGGGYVGGSAASMEPIHRPMASRLDCVIVSVEYRLAPETRAPGSVEDCYAALAWTVAHAGELGVDIKRIGVMGESAGGGMAAALALLARDRGEYGLAFQHLIYPMLDDRTCVSAQPHPYAGEFIWTPHNNHFGWASLLGVEPGSAGVSPYAAPARAESLAGLPRTFISTGALDLFMEEDLEYARRLMRDGVPVEFHIYPGGFHAFDIAPGVAVSEQARRDSMEALKRELAG